MPSIKKVTKSKQNISTKEDTSSSKKNNCRNLFGKSNSNAFKPISTQKTNVFIHVVISKDNIRRNWRTPNQMIKIIIDNLNTLKQIIENIDNLGVNEDEHVREVFTAL